MLSHWPSLRTAFGSLNVIGWLRRPRESRRNEPRRASVPRLVKKHNIDLLGLQETHLHDQGVMDAQSWWLRKNGFAAHFNLQLDQSDKGSSGLVWRESKWEHVSSVAMGQRFLTWHMRAKAGGDLRVLTGNFSCDPSQRRQQWELLESKL